MVDSKLSNQDLRLTKSLLTSNIPYAMSLLLGRNRQAWELERWREKTDASCPSNSGKAHELTSDLRLSP